MPRDELSGRERAVLFALLAAARPVTNPELERLVGIRLDGWQRRTLNERRLVESVRLGRAFTHELTDAGWRWCAGELAAAPDGAGPKPVTGPVSGPVTGPATGQGNHGAREAGGARGSSLERAHYLVFGMFSRYLDAAGLTLADIAEAGTAGPVLAARIEAGYRELTPVPGEFVPLRELRLRLPGVPRPAVDATLAELYASQRVNLIPQSNQQALTDADRRSALRTGGEDKHLISIER